MGKGLHGEYSRAAVREAADDIVILLAMRRLLPLIVAFLTSTAHAWGTQGHQVIAGPAQANLTPKSKAEIDKLLALKPGETLASISTWADEHRNPTTAAWHCILAALAVLFTAHSQAYTDFSECPQFFANKRQPIVAPCPMQRALCYDAFAILH